MTTTYTRVVDAVLRGEDLAVVQSLVMKAANLDAFNVEGWTALMVVRDSSTS